jgi:hypothetical protein
MKDESNGGGRSEFVPPLLFPDQPAKWEVRELLDETARRELRDMNSAAEKAANNLWLIVGWVPE